MTPFLYYACEQHNTRTSIDKMTLPSNQAFAQLMEGSHRVQVSGSSNKGQAHTMTARVRNSCKRPRSLCVLHEICARISRQNPRELMGDIASAWRSFGCKGR